jgi:hypothetical protein
MELVAKFQTLSPPSRLHVMCVVLALYVYAQSTSLSQLVPYVQIQYANTALVTSGPDGRNRHSLRRRKSILTSLIYREGLISYLRSPEVDGLFISIYLTIYLSMGLQPL